MQEEITLDKMLLLYRRKIFKKEYGILAIRDDFFYFVLTTMPING